MNPALAGFIVESEISSEVSRALGGWNNSGQNLVKFFSLGIIDGHNEASAAFEWNSNDDQATFFDRLHRAVTGSRLHSSHIRHLFLKKRVSIIPRSARPRNHEAEFERPSRSRTTVASSHSPRPPRRLQSTGTAPPRTV
jgi:hypothetical protein